MCRKIKGTPPSRALLGWAGCIIILIIGLVYLENQSTSTSYYTVKQTLKMFQNMCSKVLSKMYTKLLISFDEHDKPRRNLTANPCAVEIVFLCTLEKSQLLKKFCLLDRLKEFTHNMQTPVPLLLKGSLKSLSWLTQLWTLYVFIVKVNVQNTHKIFMLLNNMKSGWLNQKKLESFHCQHKWVL